MTGKRGVARTNERTGEATNEVWFERERRTPNDKPTKTHWHFIEFSLKIQTDDDASTEVKWTELTNNPNVDCTLHKTTKTTEMNIKYKKKYMK